MASTGLLLGGHNAPWRNDTQDKVVYAFLHRSSLEIAKMGLAQ